MGSTKHEKSYVDFEQPYEQNIIGLKGIVYFGIFLLLLIVITFFLMWALLNVLEDNAQETKASENPMQMSDLERLPPEPRLQAAPGFGVASPNGRVNLELYAPQAEYWELRKQWQEVWDNGNKDPKTGTVVTLPVDEAKEVFLQQGKTAAPGAQLENELQRSRMVYSDSSSGRMASIKRR